MKDNALLLKGLTAAYLRDSLTVAVFELGHDLGSISNHSQYSVVLTSLINTARNQGWLGELVAHANAQRPNIPELEQWLSQSQSGHSSVSPPPYHFPSHNALPKILFLAAEPTDLVSLRLGEEAQRIRDAVQGQYNVVVQGSLTPSRITEAILRERPTIVHYSGHSDLDGLHVEGDDRMALVVDSETLSEVFALGIINNGIQCVVLNSCRSFEHALKISQHIPYVVGMLDETRDDVARLFAEQFYGALAIRGVGRDGRANVSIPDAFKLAQVQIKMHKLPDADILRLYPSSSHDSP